MRDNLQYTPCLVCDSDNAKPLISTKVQMVNVSNDTFEFRSCENCGLVYLNPRVQQENLGKYYPGYYLPYRGSKAWGKYGKFVENGQRKIDGKRVKLAQKYLGKNSGHRILDVGCGKPSFLKKMMHQGDYLATGIDFKNDGWRDSAEEYSNIKLFETDPLDFHTNQKFDLITMWHYLEHDYHPQKTLSHLLTMSHEQSFLLIEVPDYDSISRKRFGKNWEGFHSPRHTAVYTERTLRKLLDKTGWEMTESRKYGTLDSYSLWWMSKMEQRNIDWSGSMEPYFWDYVWGKIKTSPLFMLKRWIRLGVQLVVARPQRT